MYSPELFSLLQQLRTLKATKKRTQYVKVKGSRKVFKRAKSANLVTLRPQQSVMMYNQFFTYFFLHFFKMQAIVLAKSLYKAVTANVLFKHEHQVLLYRTRFLKWHK
jgi:hypothetical protein